MSYTNNAYVFRYTHTMLFPPQDYFYKHIFPLRLFLRLIHTVTEKGPSRSFQEELGTQVNNCPRLY